MIIKNIIYHANCADGLLAAALASNANMAAAVTPCQYGKAQDDLVPAPGTLFVDFCPSTRLQEWKDMGVIVLDHHRSAKANIEFLGGVYAEESSGAMLAAERFDTYTAAPLASLVGIRDLWRKESPYWEDACDLSSAIIGLGLGYARELVIGTVPVSKAIKVGRHLRNKHLEGARNAVANGIQISTADGISVLLIKGAAFSSDATDMTSSQVVIALEYVLEGMAGKTVLSLRGKGLDVLPIAKANGGGGHALAAGCSIAGLVEPAVIVTKIATSNWKELKF